MISNKVDKILPSFTLKMTSRAAELSSQGVDVIDLGVGEPDFNTPDNIIAAAKKAMDDGFTKYTPGSGLFVLREAICEKLHRDNSLSYNPDQIIVSNGAKHSLSTCCQAILNPGDQAIIFSPYWVSFPEFIRLADGEPVVIPTFSEKNFTPDFDQLEKQINPRIKLMIINSPSNPTGAVWDNETIRRLLSYAAQYNWVVISDECYEQLVYDNEFQSTETLNDAGANVITIQSLSKTYAMTGWRIGYAAGDITIIKAMSKIQGQATSCANSIGQIASVEALTGDQSEVKMMKDAFLNRRNKMLNRINDIAGISCQTPGGAFYTFPNVTHFLGMEIDGKKIDTSFDLSDYILDMAKTTTVAGAGFGCEGHIRLSYATDEKTFLEGLNRIETSLMKLKETS